MKEFKLKKGVIFKIIFVWIPVVYFGFVLFLIYDFASSGFQLDHYTVIISSALLLLVGILFLYQLRIWWTARYFINENILSYKFGIFEGEVLIDKITTIRKSKYPTSGIRVRPCFDLKGLLIFFQTSEESHVPRSQLFISPKDEELLIRSIVAINPNIKIV